MFRDLASSTAAMRGLDGESFYGKSLVRTLSPTLLVSAGSLPCSLSGTWHPDLSLLPTCVLVLQRISYAKATSYATIAQTEGPEAVYAIKLGLRDADDAGKKSKMTVSAAQKKLADDRRKEKRGREDEGEEEEEEDEDDEEDGGPQKKKSRQDGEEQEDGELLDFSLYERSGHAVHSSLLTLLCLVFVALMNRRYGRV